MKLVLWVLRLGFLCQVILIITNNLKPSVEGKCSEFYIHRYAMKEGRMVFVCVCLFCFWISIQFLELGQCLSAD